MQLSTRRLLIYALPAIPLAALSLPLTLIVPSAYVSEVGLPIATVGLALLVIRLFDAVCDPVVGILSDRIGGRYRRKLWLVLGMPLVMVGGWGLFVPTLGSGVIPLIFFGAILSLGTTATALAYQAWGAELVTDYAGRNRVTATREAVTVVGTLLATATPALLQGDGGELGVLKAIAIFLVIALPIAGGLVLAFVPEPDNRGVTALPFADGIRALIANAPFMRLILAFFLNSLANGLPASLFLFYISEQLDARASAPVFLLIYFGMAVLSVPFWTLLSRHMPKHRVWAASLLMASVFFLIPPFLGPGAIWLYGFCCVMTGFALGADLIMPPSIQADVIDVDTAETGEQRSGFYFALWALVSKAALALAVGLAFPILGALGLDPGAGLRTPSGLLALTWLYGGIPILLKLTATALIWRFPVDAAEQARLRLIIDSRSAA